MEYGPFDLSSATDAEVLFYRWHQLDSGTTELKWCASINGFGFYCYSASGDSSGWQYVNFDLTDVYSVGDLTGQSQVWIGFVFYSDSSYSHPEGVYVDDITIRAKISGE
jgi:hypothetical protein